MQQTGKKQHITGVIMLTMTAVLWGAGFVLNDNLLKSAFGAAPNLINTIRFAVAAVLLGIVFCRKLRFNRKTLLYTGIGGVLLFVGFTLQLLGLKRTTPSHNGFLTAAYIIFVPFITWILRKKRPSWITFVGVGIAIAGLAILNFDGQNNKVADTIVGDALTLAGALMFAVQIAWTDYAYSKDEIDYPNMTFWQVLFAAVLFTLYTLIFESGSYTAITFNPATCIWRLAIVSIGGTAFAYFAQTYVQKYLAPTETSLILACESPIGAMISIIVGTEAFVWNTAVGGVLVIAAVIIIEVIPLLLGKRTPNKENKQP